MAKYHINAKNEIGLCTATKRSCRYKHIDTDQELPSSVIRTAQQKIEELLGDPTTSENAVFRTVRDDLELASIALTEADRVKDPAWLETVDGQMWALRQKLNANDNYHTFPALFDLKGELVNAKLVNSKYGQVWMIFSKDDNLQTFVESWFNPSEAKTLSTAVKNNQKKGFYVGTTEEKAFAYIKKEYLPYSQGAIRRIIIGRDGRNPGEVRIVDNGQDTLSA